MILGLGGREPCLLQSNPIDGRGFSRSTGTLQSERDVLSNEGRRRPTRNASCSALTCDLRISPAILGGSCAGTSRVIWSYVRGTVRKCWCCDHCPRFSDGQLWDVPRAFAEAYFFEHRCCWHDTACLSFTVGLKALEAISCFRRSVLRKNCPLPNHVASVR